ncbi:MAG: FHA domain-containing protein [Bacteroidales bacterium]|nr:FHA domain-containing protein [Bacteroidales bacterium]
MYKIICDYCGTENTFSAKEQQPVECSNQACQNSLKGLEVITVDIEDKEQQVQENEKLIGLKLIYQKTSEEITVKTDPKIIIGRESVGSKVLWKIEQISRSHCSIEFSNNKYTVTDLGSTNGTFIGVGTDKISCKTPQLFTDNDFLVLGREVFLIQFLKEEKLSEPETVLQEETKEIEESKKNLCTECSCVLIKLPCSCPDCGTWNE